jgi:hypothetical protein
MRDVGADMSTGNAAGYLPGDPRYGLSGEALKDDLSPNFHPAMGRVAG